MMQGEMQAMRAIRLDARDIGKQRLARLVGRRGGRRALETEAHGVGSEGRAVVKAHSPAQIEAVAQAIRAHVPAFGQQR